jgi:hypothetical protein
VAEEHGDKLRPASESLGAFLGAVLSQKALEFRAGEVIEQLTKQTGVP